MNLPWKNEKEFYDIHSKDIFSNYSFYHVALVGETKQDFLKYIIKKAKISKGSKVVDLGCGSGYVVDSLREFCNSVGISTSKECVKQCLLNYPNSNFEIANMENYEYKDATHFLALESMCYSNVEKTFRNVFANLKKGGIFYVKDMFVFPKEDEFQRKNREHWEYYWKCRASKIVDFINLAYSVGFELFEFNDLSISINNKDFRDSLKYNKIDYIIPHSNVNFLIPGEFVFVKR